MNSSNRKNSIHFIQPLHNIANVLALVPPYNNSNNNNGEFTFHKYYSVCMVTVLTVVLIFSINGRASEFYKEIDSVTPVLDVINQTLLTSSVCMAIMKASFLNIEDFKLLKTLFLKIDEGLRKEKYFTLGNNQFYLKTGLSHVIIILMIIYDVWITTDAFGTNVCIYYLLREFNQYEIFLLVLIIYNYVLSLRIRMENINRLLVDIGNNITHQLKENDISNHYKNGDLSKNVKQLRRLYDIGNQLIEIINKVFGWQLLSLWIIMVTEILLTINIGIAVVMDHRVFQGDYATENCLIFYIAFWCIEMLVSLVIY